MNDQHQAPPPATIDAQFTFVPACSAQASSGSVDTAAVACDGRRRPNRQPLDALKVVTAAHPSDRDDNGTCVGYCCKNEVVPHEPG